MDHLLEQIEETDEWSLSFLIQMDEPGRREAEDYAPPIWVPASALVLNDKAMDMARDYLSANLNGFDLSMADDLLGSGRDYEQGAEP